LTTPIFHLADPGDWETRTDVYEPAAFPSDGFIHCSTASQLSAVARNVYPGRTDLVLLTIDPDLLDEGALVYEDLYGHGEFPHIYTRLRLDAIVATEPYDPDRFEDD